MNPSNEEKLKDHIATYAKAVLLGDVIERIIFRKPGSSIYYMNFLCFGRNLVVTGDAYDAVYEVGQPQSIGFWSRCDASYLQQKLRGLSGHAEDAEVWSPEEAESQLKIMKAELRKEALEEYQEIFKKDSGKSLDESFDEFCKLADPDEFERATGCWLQWEVLEPHTQIQTLGEWHEFLNRHGQDLFGNCDMPYDIGMVRNTWIDFHVTALRMAVKQLEKLGTL